jgi:uncharacterized protein YjbI with pentapeptide repeats
MDNAVQVRVVSPIVQAVRPVEVRALGPVAAGAMVWRYRGAPHITAIVKATFTMTPNGVMTVSAPDELQPADAYQDGDPRRSVIAVGDRVPYRGKADIMVTGSAHPAQGFGREAAARLVVQRGHTTVLDKSIHVADVAPFAQMPIVYERAFGGPETDDNPIGTGATPGTSAPNFADPRAPGRPASFGPLARWWRSRDRLFGTGDRSAVDRPVAEIPADLDWDYFQSAPIDQRVEFLRGDEWITVEGFHPTYTRLASQLPEVRAVGRVHGYDSSGRVLPLHFNADSLHVQADRFRCVLTFRATIKLGSEEQLAGLAFDLGLEIGGQPVAAPSAPASASPIVQAARYPVATPPAPPSQPSAHVPVTSQPSAHVPTMAAAPPAPPSQPSAQASIKEAPPARPSSSGKSAFEGTMDLSSEVARLAAAKASTPFVRGAPTAPAMEKKDDDRFGEKSSWSATMGPEAAATRATAEELSSEDRPTGKIARSAVRAAPVDFDGTADLSSAVASLGPLWLKKDSVPEVIEPELEPDAEQDAGLQTLPFVSDVEANLLPFGPRPAAGADAPPPSSPSLLNGGRGEQTLEMSDKQMASPPQPTTPFPIAEPGARSEPATPIPGSPWAAVPAAPVPRPSVDFERTMDISSASPAAMAAPAFAAAGTPGFAPAAAAPAFAAMGTPGFGGEGVGLPPSSLEAAGSERREPEVPASRFFHQIPRPDASGPDGPPPATPPGDGGSDIPARRLGGMVPIYTEFLRRGPLSAFCRTWQLRPPQDSLTVVVKATFDIVHGSTARIKPTADSPSGDVYADSEKKRGLTYPSDFSIFKPRADVVLTGHACAPGGTATVGEVRFRFGHPPMRGFERRMAVFGERRWLRGISGSKPSAPLPFDRIPLVHENAFGGPDFDKNPNGVGYGPSERLPNLEDPAHLLTAPGEHPAPVCFAPIPFEWKERRSKTGTPDKKRFPYYPEDMDMTAWQAAPGEQQLQALSGDEPFEITGMHPAVDTIRGTLPKVRARGFSQRTAEAGGEFQEVALRLDTVIFDLDQMKLNLVWRGVLEVRGDEAVDLAGLFVFTEELAAQPATLPEARARFRAALKKSDDERKGGREPGAAQAALDEIQGKMGEHAQVMGEKRRENDERRAAEREKIRDRLRAQGLADSDIDAAMNGGGAARGAAGAAASTGGASALPNPDEVAERLRKAGLDEKKIEEVVGKIRQTAAESEQTMREAQEREARARAGASETPRQRAVRLLAEGKPLDKVDLSGADLSGLDFSGRSLVSANLKGADLHGAKLDRAILTSAQLSKADLSGATLTGAHLEHSDLHGSTLVGTIFDGATLLRADLSDARGERASFVGVKGASTRFSRGSWDRARFDDMNMEAADFSGAGLDGAVFDRAMLRQARLMNAHGTGASFGGAMLEGARAGEAQFPSCSFKDLIGPKSTWDRAMLDESTFFGATLKGATFMRASCQKTIFSGADLVDARFDRAKLGHASFLKTNLMKGSLQQANLDHADLRGANLFGCNTYHMVIDGAQFDQAIMPKAGQKAGA